MSTDEPGFASSLRETGADAGGGTTPECEVVAPTATGKGQSEEQLSALRDNLARKGKNSYYYAHTRVMDTPSWDGRQAPRRLAAADPVAPAAKRPANVTNYAWANERTKVKIYVPMEGCSTVDDAQISLTWESRCVDVEVGLPSGSRRLHIPSLHDEITAATFRKKQDKLVVILSKKDEATWYDLTATR